MSMRWIFSKWKLFHTKSIWNIFYKEKLYSRRAASFGDELYILGDCFKKVKEEEIASLVWLKNTDYTVTNKTKGVLESFEVLVTYKDANGKQLTQVRTNFGRYEKVNLEQKGSVTLESYLVEQKISDSTAMSVLYGKELSEFVVEYEITQARWTDSVHYNEGNLYY